MDFADTALIFENSVIEAEDGRDDYGEIQCRALAMSMVIPAWSCIRGAGKSAGLSVPGR